jgi:methyltransferase
MATASIILLLVTLQRLSELVIANRNTRRLRALGGIEHGQGHYPTMVALHGTWLAGLWWFGWSAEIIWPLMAGYGFLQLFRIWILMSIGRRWTTRIISMPGETLVARGPYRFMRHPNYALVLLEVPLLPLALGLLWFAALFGALNVAMLAFTALNQLSLHSGSGLLKPARKGEHYDDETRNCRGRWPHGP